MVLDPRGSGNGVEKGDKMNQVSLIGRITKDVELKYTKNSNIPYCIFRLAVPRKVRTKVLPQDTDFIDCITWYNLAKNISTYAKRGSTIAVVGSLESSLFTLPNGQKVRKIIVNVKDVDFLYMKKTNPYSGLPEYEKAKIIEEKKALSQYVTGDTKELDKEYTKLVLENLSTDKETEERRQSDQNENATEEERRESD